jgi:radical SAM superfamily enzyme YgiQ (UPF0313 family)
MRILIINPPKYKNQSYIREGRCMQTKSSWATLWPPLSLTYIAAFLRVTGFDVKLLDCIASDIDFDYLKRIISQYLPRFIVINTAFPTIYSDLSVAQLAKSLDNGIVTVVIGMVPTLIEEEIFRLCPDLDYAVVGEPEWVVKNLAQGLVGKTDIDKVRGVIINNKGSISKNPAQNFLENDINELPFPARDLLDNSRYTLPINSERFSLVSVGRGCPYNCSFCTANIFYGKAFRKRTASSVVDELEECVNKFNITNFLFWGETFTLDEKYAVSISDEIIKRKLPIKWASTSRADTLNSDMLNKMKESGCNMLSLGIEGISDETLRVVDKSLSLSDIERAIGLIKKAGIRTMGHFIFGLPYQSGEDCMNSINFSLKNALDYAQFYCAVPYPKTGLEKIARQNGWVKEDVNWTDYDLTKSIMSNGKLTAQQITRFRDLGYKKFYLRPKMFIQALREISSFSSLIKISDFMNWIKVR